MILKGKRVLLNRPDIEVSPIELTPEIKENLERENFKKWTHLQVFAIGDEVTSIKSGDMVYISKSGIEHCEVIEIDQSLKLMINEAQICIIW
jgi:hypothetical protein